MKTTELSGKALDWAVGQATGFEGDWLPDYSTDWAHGGPIIEAAGICLLWMEFVNEQYWIASITDDKYEYEERSTKPLEAAMRVYVASKLGDEVEIPHEAS